jgi:hypothetical protein
MGQARSYKAVGVALFVLGVIYLALGFSGGSPVFLYIRAPLAFLGIVLLAQAKRHS